MIEGEGGLTPGRVAEAAAFAGTSGLWNAVVHLDWNQASIDSNAVTREGDKPGDYVQWDPMEFFYLHDWNVVEVPEGMDPRLILTAQRRALAFDNGQPTAIVYRTVKGWQYGIEGRKSHGAGHKLCSPEYRATLEGLSARARPASPAATEPPARSRGARTSSRRATGRPCCSSGRSWRTARRPAGRWRRRVRAAASRLAGRARTPRAGAPGSSGSTRRRTGAPRPEEPPRWRRARRSRSASSWGRSSAT